MNLEDVIKLIDAGFSKDEITAMMSPERSSADILSHEDSSVTPETEKEPTPAAEQSAPVPASSPDQNSDLLKAIRDLTTTIQSGAILNSVFNSDNERTSYDILADVLSPDGRTKLGGDKK